MKLILLVLLALIAGSLSFTGCKKSEQAAGSAPEYNGVRVDWTKLDPVFANASVEIQNMVSLAKHAFRYGELPRAVTELEKLFKNPGLSEAQRSFLNDLLAQTRQAIAKAPSP